MHGWRGVGSGRESGPPGPLGQGWALCLSVRFRPHPKTMSQRMVYQTSHTASYHTHMETRTRTRTQNDTCAIAGACTCCSALRRPSSGAEG